MHQYALRLARQDLVEARDLLGHVIVRRAGVDRVAAHLLAGLLEHLVDREPVFDARHHHVHGVEFARLAAERLCGIRLPDARKRDQPKRSRGQNFLDLIALSSVGSAAESSLPQSM